MGLGVDVRGDPEGGEEVVAGPCQGWGGRPVLLKV